MLKKLLKIIGSFFLIVIILLVGMGIRHSLNASKYEEFATPYLEKNMPVVASWDFQQLRPLLTPESLKEFESERSQKVFMMFSKLGSLKTFDEPRFLSAKMGVSAGESIYDTVYFTMLGHFENGDAVFNITLATAGDSYLIHYINVNSNVFFE